MSTQTEFDQILTDGRGHKLSLYQKHYPHFLVEFNEPDIICLWQYGKTESNVIMIEREKVEDLITLLRRANG